MQVAFLAVVCRERAAIRVQVDHPLAPAIYITREQATELLCKLAQQVVEADKIAAALAGGAANAQPAGSMVKR